MNNNLEQELTAFREYKDRGRKEAVGSYEKMRQALEDEQKKIHAANQSQQDLSRLADEKSFAEQRRETEKITKSINNEVWDNIKQLNERAEDFTIVLYGRTMAGKSTLMEILTHGNGASIGKGEQRTTRDVRDYTWNGLKVFDVPGIAAFGAKDTDDKLALEAAKSADMALFLITDDAPQPLEADRLAELKALGKPILGIVNVKQVLSPDRASAKRKIEIKRLQNKIGDKKRLNEIVTQFREFAKTSGYDFSDIDFVSTHLNAAFLSQPERENDEELYRLSNFSAVEDFILEKVKTDGQFICYKNYITNVAIPMQDAIALFYKHSAESYLGYRTYDDKIEALDKWRENFFDSVQSRYDQFYDNIETKLNSKVNYVVANYYDSSNAGDAWQKAVESLKLNVMCQEFVRDISEEATRKLKSFADELEDIAKYSGGSFTLPDIRMDDITDYQSGMMLMAPLLAFTPVGWAGALVVGIGSWLFGDSKETKIRKAKDELRGKLNESSNEILGKIGTQVVDTLNNEILNKQIAGFRDTLIDMCEIMKQLSFEQNAVAYTINGAYQDLNFNLYCQASGFADTSVGLKGMMVARVVGKEFVIFTTSEMPEADRKAVANLLDEKVSVYTVTDENYWGDLVNVLETEILRNEFNIYSIVNDERGRLDIVEIPQGILHNKPSDEQIQLTQQITESPVVENYTTRR